MKNNAPVAQAVQYKEKTPTPRGGSRVHIITDHPKRGGGPLSVRVLAVLCKFGNLLSDRRIGPGGGIGRRAGLPQRILLSALNNFVFT